MKWREESGQITLWVLGLAVALLGLGGISVDLWRVMGERSELAVIADSAAVAGANGVDVDWFRATGEVRLLEPLAHDLAMSILAQEDVVVVGLTVQNDQMVVQIRREVAFSLLNILTAGQDPSVIIDVVGRATADLS
ncbi:MAG: pilus assembly protein TadG-related protein [Acidimicrobiia bacterium]|nr:pilus assembly protein TadG-related protein [Acidimicrobiia bacterium]